MSLRPLDTPRPIKKTKVPAKVPVVTKILTRDKSEAKVADPFTKCLLDHEMHGSGKCQECAAIVPETVEELAELLEKVRSNRRPVNKSAQYEIVEYTKGKYPIVKCPRGHVRARSLKSLFADKKCVFCMGDSDYFLYDILRRNGVDFSHKKFLTFGMARYRYDFVIRPKILIEIDSYVTYANPEKAKNDVNKTAAAIAGGYSILRMSVQDAENARWMEVVLRDLGELIKLGGAKPRIIYYDNKKYKHHIDLLSKYYSEYVKNIWMYE